MGADTCSDEQADEQVEAEAETQLWHGSRRHTVCVGRIVGDAKSALSLHYTCCVGFGLGYPANVAGHGAVAERTAVRTNGCIANGARVGPTHV